MANQSAEQANRAAAPSASRGPRLTRVGIGLALIAVVVVVIFYLAPSRSSPPVEGFGGKLNVLVRPPDRKIEPMGVDQPGALPVRPGGAMCLDANFNQPAYVYLVWIDSSGQVMPLYPWNNESLEITDVEQPPPERRPGKLVFSPLLGKTWTFGDQPGSETILMMARRTPLPKELQLGSLLKSLPSPPQLDASIPLAIAQVPEAPQTDASKPEQAPDSPSGLLAAMIKPLTEYFELVQAVQFAHAGETSENSPPPKR